MKKTMRNYYWFLVLIFAVMIFTVAVSASETPAYVTVAQPETNVIGDISAAVFVDDGAELAEIKSADIKPAAAIFSVDAELNVVDGNGNAFSTVASVIAELDYSVIPVYYIENTEEGNAVAEYLNDNFTDAFLMSASPSVIKSAQSVAPTVFGIIDYTEAYADKTELTGAELLSISNEVHSNMSHMVMLPACLANNDNVQYLHDRLIFTWSRLSDSPSKAEAFSAVIGGATGVVSDDFASVIEAAQALPEKTLTRAPLNISHAAITYKAPKNTLESVKSAFENLSAKTVEIDLRITKDGVPMLFHDASVKVTDSEGVETTYNIWETDSSILKELVITYNDKEYHYSTLEDVLAYFGEYVKTNPDRILYLDIKVEETQALTEQMVQNSIDLVKENGLENNVFLAGYTYAPYMVKMIREMLPNAPIVGVSGALSDASVMDGIIATKESCGIYNAAGGPPNKGNPLTDIGNRTVIQRGLYLCTWNYSGNVMRGLMKYGYSSFMNDYFPNLNNFPTSVYAENNISASVAPNSSISVSALLGTYSADGIEASDCTLKIIDGADLATLDGNTVTFGENEGKVSFILESKYDVPASEGYYDAYSYNVCSEPITVEIAEEESPASMAGFVTNGLVSYYSGSGNEGKTYWEDLAGDNDITHLTNPNNKFNKYGYVISEKCAWNASTQKFPDAIHALMETSSFTFEARISDFVGIGNAFLIHKGNDKFSVYVPSGASNIRILDRNSGFSINITDMLSKLQDGALVTLTFDSGELKFYCNGQLKGTMSTGKDTLYLDGTSSPWVTFGTQMTGVYESMRFYDRALTEKEVKQNYDAEGFFDGAVKTEGFSIRLKKYNGLRTIFTFDENKNTAFEARGYELLEYGAIVVPEAKYIKEGSVVTINGETRELTTSGKKISVWKDGETVGSLLDEKDGIVSYCVAIVNYKANYSDNIYYAAYSIYKAPNGETIVTISDYGIDGYKAINLYQTTLDMYLNGAINASNTDDAAVWNTLLTGAVTLKKGTHYTAEGYTDMDGNAFGDTFTFKNVPALGGVGQTSQTVTITVVSDFRNDEWVAIYHGEGALPSKTYDGRWCQLYSKLDASHTKIPNPVLDSTYSNKITTVILDSGITSVPNYSFTLMNKIDTIVYPESLTTLTGSFHYCYALNTMYLANANGQMQNNEDGLIDISHISNINTNSLFRNVRAGQKIHLPANITEIASQFYYDDWPRNRDFIIKVWCGDTAEPADGVIDLTGANITSIGKQAFLNFSSLKTLILPDSCTSIDASAFTPYTGYTGLTTVKQATFNDDIADYCTANGITYCDLSGNEYKDPLLEPGDVETSEDSVYS